MREKPLIVIIEDEKDLLELLEFRLSKEYNVEGFLSTRRVENFLAEECVDLMIVDRNLPGIEGSEFIKGLRDRGIDIPVIFLSAKSDDREIEEGFLRGGDDYITKPFSIKELLLRVKAVFRRVKPEIVENVISYRDIKLYPQTNKVFIAKKEISLTKLEFKLLLEFIKNKCVVLTREYLLDKV